MGNRENLCLQEALQQGCKGDQSLQGHHQQLKRIFSEIVWQAAGFWLRKNGAHCLGDFIAVKGHHDHHNS